MNLSPIQSLGGVYARVLAGLVEDSVRCVVTLGSPITGPASATNARRLYQAVSGRHAHHPAYSALLRRAPHVPTTLMSGGVAVPPYSYSLGFCW